MSDKPVVKLIGEDRNAFAILGRCQQAARLAGWSKERLDEFLKKARSGDYNNLLATCCEYFKVADEEPEEDNDDCDEDEDEDEDEE